VRQVMAKGGGAHRPGRMADCLQCHGRYNQERPPPSLPQEH
jgi:hypothetical protein